MKIVFMGTPSYAVPTLEALADHHEVVCVFTRPDAVSKRGKALIPSPVKECALERGLPVEAPRSLRDSAVISRIKILNPDVIVVAAFGMILPKEVLEIPAHGCVNLHASLLPRWRGAAPIQRAILAGDECAGVVLMQMEEGLDTGAYALPQSIPVAHKSTEELTDELSHLAAHIALEGLDRIANKTLEWFAQDEAFVTYAQKIAKSDVALSPALSAEENALRVQASSHSAPARMVLCDKSLAVTKAQVIAEANFEAFAQDAHLEEGSVYINKKHIVLGCRVGLLELALVKPDGKKEMPARDFAQGLQNHDSFLWKEA